MEDSEIIKRLEEVHKNTFPDVVEILNIVNGKGRNPLEIGYIATALKNISDIMYEKADTPEGMKIALLEVVKSAMNSEE